MYSKVIDCQLTISGNPTDVVQSARGTKYFLAWLKIERNRILKDHRRLAEIREDKNGLISLWVNHFRWSYTCPCQDCRKFYPIDRTDDDYPFNSGSGIS